MTATQTSKTRAATSLGEFASAGSLVFAGSMLLNVAGFAFHALVSRRLGVSDYGSLYALLSLYSLATIPPGLFTAVVMKYAAEFRAVHDDGHVRGLVDVILRWFGAVGLLYALISLLGAQAIAAFVHIPAWTVPLVGILCAVGILLTALRALGQGVHQFRGYGLSLGSEGIGKVAFVLVGAVLGLTVGRALGAFIGGMVVGLLMMLIPLYARYYKSRRLPIRLDWKRIIATSGGAAVLAITAGSMGFADVVLVKHFFNAHQSGLYAAASLNGKMLLYVVGFIPGVLIPQATHRHARGERTRETLWSALGIISLAGVVGVALYAFGGIFLLHLLNGAAFSAAVPLLTPYAGAMALLALTNTLGGYGIATHRLGFAVPLLVATVLMFVAMSVWHSTLHFVTIELLAGNALMVAAVGVSLFLQRTKNA